MTTTGENRARYAEHHADTDPRPSRFTPAYAEWAARADAWVSPETCTAHNGSYSCVLPEGHDGLHSTAVIAKRRYVFRDNYSLIAARKA